MDCQLIGRWRIVEADIWDRDHLDLVEPAMIVIEADGHGEIAFRRLIGQCCRIRVRAPCILPSPNRI